MSISRKTWLIAALVVAAGAWLAFNLWSLERYPPVTCDEAFYMRSAGRFVEAAASGQRWPALGVMFYLPHGRLYWLALGGLGALLGETLFVARLVSLLAWALLIAATYAVGRLYGSQRIGLWAAALAAATWLSLHTGHRVRPDMLAAAAGVASVALMALTLPRRQAALYAAFGFALVFQLDIHLNLLHLAWPMAAWTVFRCVRQRAFGHLAVFGGGLALGAVLVAWLHLGPALGTLAGLALADPAALAASYIGGGTGGQAALPSLVGMAASFGQFWWQYYAWLAPLVSLPQAALFLGGLIYALLKGTSEQRVLAGLVVLSSLTFAVVNASYQLIGYAMLWVPLYLVLGVSAVFGLAERFAPGRAPRQLPAAILAGCLLIYGAGGVYLAATHGEPGYEAEAERLRAVTGTEARVLGSPLWWHAYREQLVDEVLLAPTNSTLWWNAIPDEQGIEADVLDLIAPDAHAEPPEPYVRAMLADDLRPEYVIEDGVIGCQTTRTPLSEALAAVVEELCRPVAQLDLGEYGVQTVYACDW